MDLTCPQSCIVLRRESLRRDGLPLCTSFLFQIQAPVNRLLPFIRRSLTARVINARHNRGLAKGVRAGGGKRRSRRSGGHRTNNTPKRRQLFLVKPAIPVISWWRGNPAEIEGVRNQALKKMCLVKQKTPESTSEVFV